MLLKTKGEKMSVLGYPTMSMKIKALLYHTHDIYEKKGLGSNRRSKTQRGACARDRPGFVSRPLQSSARGL
jgi:hypothetical protein